MVDNTPKPEKKNTVEVPFKLLTEMQEQIAAQDKRIADAEAKAAGMETMLATASTTDEPKLRERKTFEPKFRTVRVRKFPKAGGEPEYVVGYTSRGAYQVVDRSGVSPQVVDMLDIIFLGDEPGKDGKFPTQAVPLLDFINKGEQVHCKILETKRDDKKVPTGEEIAITVFDPQHGLRETGDSIDGYIITSDIQYKVAIPGRGEHWIDATFVNR